MSVISYQIQSSDQKDQDLLQVGSCLAHLLRNDERVNFDHHEVLQTHSSVEIVGFHRNRQRAECTWQKGVQE